MEKLDHADIVVTHTCNKNCRHCIDSFRGTSQDLVKLEDVEKFMRLLRKVTPDNISVLLLGGEPTTAGAHYLSQIAKIVHKFGFRISMSTNGVLKGTIQDCLPYFDSVQITIQSDSDIYYWRPFRKKINIKIAGDEHFTFDKLCWFSENTADFYRRSVSMYFTPDFNEICTDKKVWDFLNTLNWSRNGSYMYAFAEGVRYKKCIKGETNVIDEPTIPKLYPNGNYNKTWNNENPDFYFGLM